MVRVLGIFLLLAVAAFGGWALWQLAEGPAPNRRQASLPGPERRIPPRPAEGGGIDERRRVTPSADQAAVSSHPGEIVPRASRDVTPPGVTRGPTVTGPLVRVPGPEKPAATPAPPKPRLERLFRPVVDSAGTIATASGRLEIAGVEAPAPDASCGQGPSAWPCGRIARAELRRFIRGRAIECEVPPGAENLPETVRCSVGGDDIGEWLVRQGWARPEADTYGEAAKQAAAERRGLWGDGPR